MNFYEKMFLSTYAAFAKTNWLNPVASAVSALSILHIFNFLSLASFNGFDFKTMENETFLVLSVGTYAFLMWLHYLFFINGKSLPNRLAKLEPKTKFWSGFSVLMYTLVTFFIFFWTIDALWMPFIIVTVVFTGLALNAYFIKNESKS